MKDKNPLYDELKYYMEQLEEEYDKWFPQSAYMENSELLLRLYEEKMNPQALDILTRYNRFLFEILK